MALMYLSQHRSKAIGIMWTEKGGLQSSFRLSVMTSACEYCIHNFEASSSGIVFFRNAPVSLTFFLVCVCGGVILAILSGFSLPHAATFGTTIGVGTLIPPHVWNFQVNSEIMGRNLRLSQIRGIWCASHRLFCYQISGTIVSATIEKLTYLRFC